MNLKFFAKCNAWASHRRVGDNWCFQDGHDIAGQDTKEVEDVPVFPEVVAVQGLLKRESKGHREILKEV